MKLEDKEISYTTTNTYSTLNTLTADTKRIWFVCHGMGYLSRYFLKYFEGLNPKDNYIIAPQAQSKYYLPPKFQHVGGSWLTKENTIKETENIMRYFDAVFEAVGLPNQFPLIIMGYSQGVSVAMRYMARRQLQCEHLILHSGGIPKELTTEDFKYFNGKVYLVYGTNDEYLNESRINEEINRAKVLLGKKVAILPFEGKHEVNVDFINQLK
jgi:predicted esterase